MSAEPLFLDDIAALQAALRLTDLRVGSDAVSILEQGLRSARFRFFQRLGISVVAAIQATDFTENPSDDDEMRRYVGNLCEVELVRLELFDRLPILFMDASGAAREAFNNEGAFRSMDRQVLEAARARIEAQVENWLAYMAGEIELGDGELAQAYTQQKPTPLPRPGDTLFIGPDGASLLPFGLDAGSFDGNFIPDPDSTGSPP